MALYADEWFHGPSPERWLTALYGNLEQDMKESYDPSQDQDETQPSVPLPLKLSQFFDSGSLSDTTLMVGSSVFHVHKLILSSWSPVFKEMLLEKSKSDESHVLEEAQEYEAIFSDFLRFMYTETIEICKDTVYSFHKLSKKYKVEEICDLCEEFLIGEVSNNNIAHQALTDAEEFGLTKVYEQCFKYLETNFFCLSDSCLKKMSPRLFLKLLESSDLVVISELDLFNQALDWLCTGGDERKDEHLEYTEDVISKIHFAQMSSSELSILKSRLPTHPKMNDRLKQCLQESLCGAFEWKALASCEKEFNLVPQHIRTTLSEEHCVDPRIYIPEPFSGYQTLFLSEKLKNTLTISVTGVSANNTISEESSMWSVTGSAIYNEKSKKCEICYWFKPGKIHTDRSYRLVILTNVGRFFMNPTVITSKGVATKTGVKVEQVLHHTSKELMSVKIKVVIMVKMRKSDLGQLQMVEESREECRLTDLFQQRLNFLSVPHIESMYLDPYDDELD